MRPSTTSREIVRIEKIVTGGAGLARLATGEVVLVPKAASGEVVEIEHQKKQVRILRVVEPSPDRRAPPCAFVDACGGCNLMFLRETAQLRTHESIVEDALLHSLRGVALPKVQTIEPCSPLGYRTRARFFAKSRGAQMEIGYRRPASHEIAAVDACLVLDAALDGLLFDLKRVLSGSRGSGDIQASLDEHKRPIVVVHWTGELSAELWSRVDRRVDDRAWAGAEIFAEGATVPARFGVMRASFLGPDGKPILVDAGGFAQPSAEGARVLATIAHELVLLSSSRPRHLLELFAGAGTLSVLLSTLANKFTALEQNPEAVSCLRENLAARGILASVLVADAEAFSIPKDVDVVVLDPPRSGAKKASAAIAASRAKSVVYVSCDPMTLARDLRALVEGRFRITDIRVVELFPQTSHMETVVRLER